MASKAQWAAVEAKIKSLSPSERQSYYEMMADELDSQGRPKATAFKTALSLLDMKGTGTMAAKKSTKRRGKKAPSGRKTGTAKATASAPKTGAKKRGKKNAGQIPLPILKKRLTKLARIVNERS